MDFQHEHDAGMEADQEQTASEGVQIILSANRQIQWYQILKESMGFETPANHIACLGRMLEINLFGDPIDLHELIFNQKTNLHEPINYKPEQAHQLYYLFYPLISDEAEAVCMEVGNDYTTEIDVGKARRIAASNWGTALMCDVPAVEPLLAEWQKNPYRSVTTGLFIAQFGVEESNGQYSLPDLFSHVERQARQLHGGQPSSTFSWAYNRVQIAAGYAGEFTLDYPLAQIAAPFVRLAPMVVREGENAEFKREVNRASHPIAVRLLQKFGPQVLADGAVGAYLEAVKPLHAHGLTEHTATELLVDLLHERRDGGGEIELARDLLEAIFIPEQPWHFEPDVKLSECWNVCNDQELRQLANASGPNFRHTVPVYEGAGRRLAALDGVHVQEAILFTADITAVYGIENEPRATRVVEFVIAFLEEIPNADRFAHLDLLRDIALRYAPESEIAAKLESGPETSFELPGFAELGATVRCEGGRADLSQELVRRVVLQCDQPLAQRIQLRHGLGEEYEPGCPISFFNLGRSPLELIERQDGSVERASDLPALRRLLNFYKSAFQEVRPSSREVFRLYFAFCSQKQEDPLAPEPGLLRCIDHVSRIGSEVGIEALPSSRRGAAIAQLLELRLGGVISETEWNKVVEWLFAEEEFQRALGLWETAFDEQPAHSQRLFESFDYIRMHRLVRMATDLETLLLLRLAFDDPDEFKEFARKTVRQWYGGEQCRLIPEPTLTKDEVALAGADAQLIALQEGGLFTVVAMHLSRDEFDEAREIILISHENRAKAGELTCLGVSRGWLEWTVGEIGEVLGKRQAAEDAPDEINRRVQAVVDLCVDVLGTFYSHAGFDFRTAVEERLREEYHLGEYLELVPLVARFKSERLGSVVRPSAQKSAFPDALANDHHIVRGFLMTGLRLFQLANREADIGAARLSAVHGEDSQVSLSAGLGFYSGMNELALGQGGRVDLRDCYEWLVGDPLERFVAAVDRQRLAWMPGGPLGIRLHLPEPASEEYVQLMAGSSEKHKTPMRMLHAGTSWVEDASQSTFEVKFKIFRMAVEGLVDPNRLDAQPGATHRLSEHNMGIACSSAILGSLILPPFEPKHFIADPTNDKLAGRRIGLYDAYDVSDGRRKNAKLPFMCTGMPLLGLEGDFITGRSDINTRWDLTWGPDEEMPDISSLDDFDITYAVITVLRQAEVGGPYAALGRRYMAWHKQLLEDYGLEGILHAPWVYLRETDAYLFTDLQHMEHYEQAILPCMAAWRAHKDGLERGEGLIHRVRENVCKLYREMVKIRAEMFKDIRYRKHVEAALIRPDLHSPYHATNMEMIP